MTDKNLVKYINNKSKHVSFFEFTVGGTYHSNSTVFRQSYLIYTKCT